QPAGVHAGARRLGGNGRDVEEQSHPRSSLRGGSGRPVAGGRRGGGRWFVGRRRGGKAQGGAVGGDVGGGAGLPREGAGPPVPSGAARASSVRTLSRAAARVSASPGGTRTPAPAMTSGRAPASEATTGQPRAMASSAGRPKPSDRDGTASAAAPR